MTPYRIDVHHHYVTPGLVEQLAQVGVHHIGGAPVPAWTLDDSLAMMDRHEIAAALLSVPVPLQFGDIAASRRMTRSLNEFGAHCVARAPERFGLLATLPLPDVEGALDEIAYAFDVLGTDGIALLSNHGGVYLGDACFDPVFAELDRRGAVVHVHPAVFTGRRIATDPHAGSPVPTLEPSLLEFVFDTTRAVANLVVSGALARYPRMRLILAHAGGVVPYLRDRILDRKPILRRVAAGPPPSQEELVGLMKTGLRETRQRLRDLYYDTALSTDEVVLRAVSEVAPVSHVLLGTDFPFAQDIGASLAIDALARYRGFDRDDRRAIEASNAAGLFPRLAPSLQAAA
jgi:predicted TIM-barrel fold metal-dependent hydrolase